MRYLLKNFIVFILTCCMTTCVCCANHGMERVRKERDAYKITVTDQKGAPILGLELKVVGKEHIKATTDKDGVAKFEGWCPKFHKWAEENETGEIRMKVMLTDPKYKRYKTSGATVKVSYRYSSGCEFTIKMGEFLMNKPYKKRIQAKAMRESLDGLALDGAGNLLFYSVCLEKKPELPANVTGECVRIFKDVDTQYESAVALAQAYVYEKVGPEHKIECKTDYKTYFNDDYLACTSNNLSHVFEFQFEDLIESFGGTVQYDTLEGLCTVYGGKFSFVGDRLYCFKDKFDQTQQLCNKLATVSSRFAISVVLSRKENRCFIDLKAKGSNDTLSTYGKLNPFVFQKYQTKFDNSTKVLIGRYVESILGSDFRSLQCASLPRRYVGSRVVSGTEDDILECKLWVNSNPKPYPIEFVFDDLYEFSDITSQGDKSKMTCLTNDGTYVAGRCVGVSEAQCKELGRKADVNVNFNSALKICELPDAATQEGWDKVGRSVEAIGWATLAVLGVIFSGGTATPALMALGAAATVANSAIAFGGEVNESVANKYAAEVLGLIAQCGCDTKCANGICKACESCKDCDVVKIYRRLPYAITFSNQGFESVLKKQVASIQSCVKPEQLDDLKREYTASLKEMGEIRDSANTASNVTAWVSIVTPSNLGKKAVTITTKAAPAISKTGSNIIDLSSRTDALGGIIQSDSTSTTQPPNQ